MKKGDAVDPKGLVQEAYNMEGLTEGECRSIFLDWALSLPEGADTTPLITTLLERHGVEGHPMTGVLREGLQSAGRPRRRGGWRSRARP